MCLEEDSEKISFFLFFQIIDRLACGDSASCEYVYFNYAFWNWENNHRLDSGTY